jgi:hypothetical protein
MWEVPNSNTGRDTGYPCWGFKWFFSVPTGNVWLVPGLRHGSFFPNPFQFINRPPWTINSHFVTRIFCTNYFLLCSVDCSQNSWKSIRSFKSESKSNCRRFYYCISHNHICSSLVLRKWIFTPALWFPSHRMWAEFTEIWVLFYVTRKLTIWKLQLFLCLNHHIKWGVIVLLHTFLISVLDENKWSPSLPGEESPVPIGPVLMPWRETFLCLPGTEPRLPERNWNIIYTFAERLCTRKKIGEMYLFSWNVEDHTHCYSRLRMSK